MEGYHQYDGGISSVRWRDIISTVEGYHQYDGGISSVRWRDIISTMKRYRQYSGGMSSVLIGTGKFSVIETKITFALNR